MMNRMPSTPLQVMVAGIESNHDQWAMRFEPEWNESAGISELRSICPNMDFATRSNVCATSWGLYQIMGSNLYGGACGKVVCVSPAEYCADVNMQHAAFLAFIAQAGFGTTTAADLAAQPLTRAAFARMYNGPGDVGAYEQSIVQQLQLLGYTIIT